MNFHWLNYRLNYKVLLFSIFCLIHAQSNSNITCSGTYFEQFEVIRPKNIITPSTISELQAIIQKEINGNHKISISGTGKSQGGQILVPNAICPNAICIDTSCLNKIINLDVKKKLVTVEPGVTWLQLQKKINPYNLSIKAMQSYADFSIGGSISVNAHGQDLNHIVVESVQSFKLIGPDGKIIKVSRDENSDLFRAAIGGYGLFGVIIEIVLELTENYMLKKKINVIESKDYYNFFFNKIKNNNKALLHSIRLEIAPNNLFKRTIAITYYKTSKSPSEKWMGPGRKKSNDKINLEVNKFCIDLLRQFKTAKNIRLFLEQNFMEKPEVLSRNEAMSSVTQSLTSKLKNKSDILQEYFIPCKKLNCFLKRSKKIIEKYKINLVNATVRYVKKCNDTELTYAPEDMFAVVFYINVPKTHKYYHEATHWTRLFIDLAINCGGTYYLPYHLFATGKQIRKAYPNFDKVLNFKKQFDPKEIFVNNLYYRYKL